MLSHLIAVVLTLGLMACGQKHPKQALSSSPASLSLPVQDTVGMKKAYFASGCFWCVEAVFESVIGVVEVVSGYAGGKAEDATYEKVSSGDTGHAETVCVYYIPGLIKYETLLTVFFDSHDPTTLNRQGPDSGTQYRSAVFYTSENEKILAESTIKSINDSKIYSKPIVTALEPFSGFYPAEDYHQNYERLNPDQGYVRAVSIPRLKRFQSKHPELLKQQKK